MTQTHLAASRSLRSRRKLDQILQASGQLFRQHGYGATSMDAVAGVANVSKATLYAYFNSKQQLFAAVIAAEDAQGSSAPSALIAADVGHHNMPAQLLRCGRVVFEQLLAPKTIETHRMVAAEAARFPELGRAYYENGAVRLLQRLEELFAAAMAAGALRKANPRRAAEQFIGLVRGDLQLRALLGLQPPMSPSQADAVIRSGVDTFYRAYAPADTPVVTIA